MTTTQHALTQILRWYARQVYGQIEGRGRLPFYCDPARVGAFAVAPARLARGEPSALFQLLITLTMYQSRRDVDIMAKQRAMPRGEALQLTRPRRLLAALHDHACPHVRDAHAFDEGCDVRRDWVRGGATCATRPGAPCHVKAGTTAIARMGDMGKLPTSAWLHLQAGLGRGDLRRLCDEVCDLAPTPAARAELMVAHIAQSYHVGEKLGAFFVSALAMPTLAPGLTPWFPRLDGHHLLVIDANVRRALARLHPRGAQAYDAQASWLRAQAARLNLPTFHRAWPAHSPRLVQQAIYWYCSRANRDAHGLTCDGAAAHCVRALCPFH